MSALKLIAVMLAIIAVAMGQESSERSEQSDRQNSAQWINFLRLLLWENKPESSVESEERQVRDGGTQEMKTLCRIEHTARKLDGNAYEEVTCTKTRRPNDLELNIRRSKYCYASGSECKYKTETRKFMMLNNDTYKYNDVPVKVPVGCICTPITGHTYVVGRNMRSMDY